MDHEQMRNGRLCRYFTVGNLGIFDSQIEPLETVLSKYPDLSWKWLDPDVVPIDQTRNKQNK